MSKRSVWQEQSNYSSTDVMSRPDTYDVDAQLEVTPRFVPEQTHRGISHDRLAKRAQRKIRAYLAVGTLFLAGSVVATEHYKPDLKEIQRHVIDQVVDHSSDYADNLKAETFREYDKIAEPYKPTLDAPSPFVRSISISPHQEA